MEDRLNQVIQQLEDKGVIIIDPRQVYVAPEVNIDRIYPECVLYPGTRLTGKRTLIGTGAKIGTEGPAVIHDAIIGRKAEVASGYLAGCTLMPEASAGANSHFRAGTLLEETATTAHCVGLKQTILMYSVTLGSLINFCDVLMSGGRSRKEHSEVGSGFIHFNFTPYGVNGDKATASLIGNVVDGVFLDQKKIFLGGMSGMVGPVSVGFGAMTVAGQVIRHSVEAEIMHAESDFDMDKVWSATEVNFSDRRLTNIKERNFEYITQLYVLKEWYKKVRLVRCLELQDEELELVTRGAIETIQSCIKERVKRYNSFAKEWELEQICEIDWEESLLPMEVSAEWKAELKYDEWIWGLSQEEKDALHAWLAASAQKMRDILYN